MLSCSGHARHQEQCRQPRHGDTPTSQSFHDTPGATERRTAVVLSRRIGMPQDIADAILFLASDRSAYINGDEITVDSGYANMLMNLVPRPGFDEKPG
jgi:NAD(P)-dependent dehydrogenase (short-subunit alcohol dehydrogenase family)